NSTAPILLCLYAAAGLEQRVPQRQLRGTTQNDILKEYIARNTYIYPPEFSLRLAVDLIEYSARKMPHWHPISISGYHIRESLTAQQPDNNIARVSIQALAAVLGGTQSLHTNSRDEALGLPTEDSVRIALRTQQIIAHESGVGRTADPLGGSYYLESLTRTIETKVTALIKRVQQLGGARKAIESGFVHRQIQESAYKFQRSVDEGQTEIVGI